MADVVNIYAKLDINTKAFDSSLAGIKKEMATLKGLVGNNLLSSADQQAVQARFGALKDQMEDLKTAAGNISGDAFSDIARAGGVAASSISAIVGVTSLLGIESKKVQEVEKTMLTLISVSSALQQVADAKRLKGMIVNYAQMLKNLVLFRTEKVLLVEKTAATGALTVAQAINTKGVGLATKAQLIWNAAMAASPIGLLVAAIAALVAGIVLLVKWMGNSSKEIEEQNKQLAEYNEALAETAKSTQEIIDANQALSDELAVINGEITQYEADRRASHESNLDKIQEADEEYLEFKKKILEDEILTDAQKNEEIRKAYDELQKKKKALDEQYQIQLEIINTKEVQDEKKKQDERNKIASEAAKKRAADAEKLRQDELQKEIDWLKNVSQTQSIIEEGSIAKRLTQGTEKAFKDFVEKTDSLFEEITTDWKGSFAETFKDMEAGDILGLPTKAKRDELLKQQINFIDNYYKALEEATKKAKEERDQLAEEQFQDEIKIIDKRIEKEKLSLDEVSDLIAKATIERNKKLEENETELQNTLTALSKEGFDRRYSYAIETTQKYIDVQKISIEATEKGLETANKGSEEYNILLGLRAVEISNQIANYRKLISLTKEQIQEDKTLSEEQKAIFEITEIQAYQQEIYKLQDSLQQTFGPTLQEQVDQVLNYSQLALQTFSDYMNTIVGFQLSELTKQVEANLDALNAAEENALGVLEETYNRGDISYGEYLRQKAALENEYRKKENEQKNKLYKKEKEARIWQAVVGGAGAVINGLNTQPFLPLGIIMGALAGVLAGVQIAQINSETPPTFATGGMVTGPGHSQGGVPIMAEGGEYIIQKSIASKPGMSDYLDGINNGTQQSQPSISVIDEEALRRIVTEVNSIPVQVTETDITRTQRKVSSIETKASW